MIFSPTAKKQFLNLDKKIQIRIKAGILKLAIVPPQGDIAKLKGREDQYRLRIGDWRIIFRQIDVIQIIAILPRGQAYK
ncbi:MAG: type II toxin-antitoxin system RelE/ParE family toxin [Syntrophomonadaceae bacterium]|nr:type II toxin-antitoxin system RelE/ParE family toxin [Syntrophomonadaceae bacterium]